MKKRIIIATIKKWNVRNAEKFIADNRSRCDIKLITDRVKLSAAEVKAFDPHFIFFPHWSWFIPAEIHENFECVVFHMTDLPFGRGGSPLQNLIMRGIKRTKVSAIRACRGLDAGPVYLKTPVLLHGSAEEIFERVSGVIFEKMIPRFLAGKLVPRPQRGVPVLFERRKPEASRIPANAGLDKFYDFIRMLDAEGYPPAFLETETLRLEFSSAQMGNGFLEAKIIAKPKEQPCKKGS